MNVFNSIKNNTIFIKLKKLTNKYSNVVQKFQLTLIYLFAFLDLFQTVLKNVYTIGYFPEILSPFYPIIRKMLVSPFFQIWASPEKIFILSYLFVETIIIRGLFHLSKLVKYHILLIFSCIMIQGLIMNYWELILHRQIPTLSTEWTYGLVDLVEVEPTLAIVFFLNLFLIFAFLYVYSYISALQGKFITLPGMEWLTDSIAFWIHIKTPTMRFGNYDEEIE